MSLISSAIEKVADMVTDEQARVPVGMVRVFDPNPINWLYITYNTVEELVRVDSKGNTIPAALSGYHWVDDKTLDITVRDHEEFPDGQPLDAVAVKRSFDELIRWKVPHPPGNFNNHDPRTTMEVTGPRTVRMHLPEVDGGTVGKLRAMHLMNARFWEEVGFGYKKNGTGEGHW